MKRFVFKLLVFILAGAIINVAVAWACAIYLEPTWKHLKKQGQLHLQGGNELWAIHLMKRAGATELYSSSMIGASFMDTSINLEELPQWSRFRRPLSERNDTVSFTVWHEHAYGWPALAMGCQFGNFHQVDGKAVTPPGLPNSQYSQSTVIWKKRVPLGIYGPGFAINTVFYAAIVWAFFAVPGYIKSRRRIKRGVCVRCAYPVGVTSAVCSECGTAIPSPSGRG